jgi:hypothetical protein
LEQIAKLIWSTFTDNVNINSSNSSTFFDLFKVYARNMGEKLTVRCKLGK